MTLKINEIQKQLQIYYIKKNIYLIVYTISSNDVILKLIFSNVQNKFS